MEMLIIGANSALSTLQFTLKHSLSRKADVSVFCLNTNGKVNGDEGMVFYGAPNSACGSVKISDSSIEFDLNAVPSHIKKFAITATLDQGVFGEQDDIRLKGTDFECLLETQARSERALILLEIYKHNNAWKVRCVGQGFNGGLQPLAELYGVDIAADTDIAAADETPVPKPIVPPVNLSKISLTKSAPKVDLSKRAGDLGLIKVNLNWNKKAGGFFASKIDLDLGAFIELNNGHRQIIQALGNSFECSPYIELLADDPTGASQEGTWLHIDGNKLQDVKQIIIFAFIYKGVTNWHKIGAKVTLHVPEMPPIETKLTEQDKNKSFCAVAAISVNNGFVNVEQLNRLFLGHEDCDEGFGWGFNWKLGSK
ncbi:MAG: tellurite resistance protein TerA [Psychromonas sp.]|jgi:tellurite resistance protein TerA